MCGMRGKNCDTIVANCMVGEENQQGHHEDDNLSIRSLGPATTAANSNPAHNPTLTPGEQLSVT